MEEKRTPARKQSLPKTEVEFLSTLFDQNLYNRILTLYSQGWTLQSIGDSFNPPRTRTTIRYWVGRADTTHVPSHVTIPTPKKKVQGYVSRRPVSPGISSSDRAHIEALSPLARRYRSKMVPSSPQAVANDELTQFCLDLISQNVTVKQLAEAAGVTYRAMARRLGR
jgi:hypothetical protein